MERLLFGLKLGCLVVLAVSAVGNPFGQNSSHKPDNHANQIVQPPSVNQYALSNRAADGIRFPHDYQLSATVPDAVLVGKTTALSNRISLAHFRTRQIKGAYV